MKMDPLAEEIKLLEELKKRDIKAFVQLYQTHRDDLILFAFSQLQDRSKVGEAIDELFEDLWKSNRFAEMQPPLYPYLLLRLRAICERKISR
jgi:DNA-directed RNA polymerase specialized sigma24 family protein